MECPYTLIALLHPCKLCASQRALQALLMYAGNFQSGSFQLGLPLGFHVNLWGVSLWAFGERLRCPITSCSILTDWSRDKNKRAGRSDDGSLSTKKDAIS